MDTTPEVRTVTFEVVLAPPRYLSEGYIIVSCILPGYWITGTKECYLQSVFCDPAVSLFGEYLIDTWGVMHKHVFRINTLKLVTLKWSEEGALRLAANFVDNAQVVIEDVLWRKGETSTESRALLRALDFEIKRVPSS